MRSNNIVNFVIASDANYFRHYAALFASIFEFSPNICVRIFVVGDCGCDGYALFKNWVLRQSESHDVIPLVIDESLFNDVHVGDYHLSVVTYFRLLAPAALRGKVDRFLYLDGDMIVRDDLRKVYDMEMGDAVLAAVPEPIFYNESSLSLEYGIDVTFNAGLLLVDVEKFCEQKIGERCLEFALSRTLRFHDQDALNEILKGKWIQIDPRWNMQIFSPVVESDFSQYDDRVATCAFENPGLVHYVGPRKPWMPFCNHPYRKEYWKFNGQTPWGKKGYEWGRFLHWVKGKVKRSLKKYYAA